MMRFFSFFQVLEVKVIYRCNTACVMIVIEDISHGSVLDHFNLMYVFILPRVPNGCRSVLKKGSNICLKDRFLNFPIMCLDVSFNKFQGVKRIYYHANDMVVQ